MAGIAEAAIYDRGAGETPSAWWQELVRTREIVAAPSIPSSGDFSLVEHLYDLDYYLSSTAGNDALIVTTGTPNNLVVLRKASGIWGVHQTIGLGSLTGISKIVMSDDWAVIAHWRLDTYYYTEITIFQKSGGSWSSVDYFDTSGLFPTDSYLPEGLAISPSGDWIMLGIRHQSGSTPYVLVYKRTGSSWSYSEALTSPDTAPSYARFGYSAAISDVGVAVIGYYNCGIDATNGGRAYIFELSGSAWSSTQTISRPSIISSAYFGNDVDISDDASAVLICDQRARGWTYYVSGGSYANNGQLVSYGTICPTLGAVSPDGLTVALVGTYYAVTNTPVRVWELSGGTWGFSQEIFLPANNPSATKDTKDITCRDGNLVVSWFWNSAG